MSDQPKDLKDTLSGALLHIGPQLDSGAFSCVRDDGTGALEFGEVAPMVEGKPMSPTQEIVTLEHTDDPYTLRIASSTGRFTSDGPAQVSTPRYRSNYDAINWGARSGTSKNDKVLN
jgi:hypothetical protein